MIEVKSHEYADIFPMIEGDRFKSLVADIKQNGLHEKIWMFENKILDGRNRYKACLQAGVSPEFQDYEGDDALQFVLSLNLERRHLNSGQCAFIAAKIKPMIAVQAKERQLSSLKQNQSEDSTVVQKIGQREDNKHSTKSNNEAAKKVGNTNSEYVRQAEKIHEEAPDVEVQVMSGNLGMSDAIKVSKLEPEKRAKVIEKVQQGRKASAVIKETEREVSRASVSPAIHQQHRLMVSVNRGYYSIQR